MEMPNYQLTQGTGFTGPFSGSFSAAAGTAPGAAAPAPSGISNAMGGMLALQAGGAVAGIFSSVFGFLTAQVQQESQAKMAIRDYDHKEKLGIIDRDMKLGQINTQEQQQQIMKDAAVAHNRAVEDRKQAEDGKKIMDAKIAQLKLNARTGNLRSQRVYGSPAVAG